VGSRENLPLNYANWYESYAFCIWDGGFLPSEAEWEYAAAGGSQQREYPWGSTAPGTDNQYAIYEDLQMVCFYPNRMACMGVDNIAPVGTATLGLGRWGQLDLVGEVAEWTVDSYSGGPYSNPCVDCTVNPPVSGNSLQNARRERGGVQGIPSLHPPLRGAAAQYWRDGFIGLRCARSP